MRSRWFMPLFSTSLGGLVLLASWLGGNPGLGWFGFGILAGLGLVFLLGRRSETISGLGGPGRDERWAAIDIHATALTGLVIILALTGFWLWELAHGREGNEYARVMAIGGIAYIVSVAFLRWRS
ncbi:MAG TPA: hypothetical protein VH306_08765 [Gaiellaceae bacterium]|jgi:hypothetical protein